MLCFSRLKSLPTDKLSFSSVFIKHSSSIYKLKIYPSLNVESFSQQKKFLFRSLSQHSKQNVFGNLNKGSITIFSRSSPSSYSIFCSQKSFIKPFSSSQLEETSNLKNLKKKIVPYIHLMRLHRPIGTWLLLWPCYWSLLLATPPHSIPDLNLFLLFGIGALIMRGAGCTINDMVDRDIDKHVTRTKTRPLVSGAITISQAISFLGFQLSIGLGILLSLNTYSIFMAFPSMFVVGIYPFMKRFTYWPQFILGLAFNWGALVGYSAVLGHNDWEIVLPLYVAGIFWTLVYDTIYAHQDKEDDQLIGVKSTALLFGKKTKTWLGFFSSSTIALLTVVGIMSPNMHWPYFFGVGLGGLHLLWQLTTLNIDDPNNCLKRFVSNKWFGAIIASSILINNFISP